MSKLPPPLEEVRCGICLFPLPPHLWDPEFEDDFQPSFAQGCIDASAQRGCENCAILAPLLAQQIIRPWEEAEWRHDWNDRFLEVLHDEEPFETQFQICTLDPRYVRHRGFDEPADSAHPYLEYGTKLPAGGTGDEASLSQAGRWMDDCRVNHPKCQPKPNPNFVPNRLLHIDGSVGPFRLLENHDNQPRTPVPYAALSHRWSPETETIILTKANLESRQKQGITVDVLPRMMLDAILVLRRLGIEYVWIDSLCIVQDSAADWHSEAGQMADVYSNAELTLSATWVPGVGQSLFCQRQDPAEFSTTNIGPIQANGTRPCFIRPRIPHFNADNLETGWSDLYERKYWPLMDRGWVYQEQFLSRRSLHFMRHELIWICLEKHACECGLLHKTEENLEVDPDPPLTMWKSIVEAYSQRVLTKPSDRLPAIAGVAARYSASTYNKEPPGRYLCGLWERDFLSLLGWSVVEESCVPRPQLSEPMPTWSWAATLGEVEFQGTSGSNEVEVVDVRVEYHGESFVGRVKEAHLTLAGPVVVGTVHFNTTCSTYDETRYHQSAHDPSCSDPPTKGWVLDSVVGGSLTSSVLRPDFMLCCSEDSRVPVGSKVTCLVFSPGSRYDYQFYHPFVLVLQKVPGTEGSGRPLYRRIGSVWSLENATREWADNLPRQTLEII
ncbi:heterokaryon incompatibility protein-domain-containing protein [Podospora conica]|nr:heterokaryon incompatibility protein-domain-containing protein [Schizothecium conicum]